ncbi:EMI domain-containing protein 1 [Liparis tanakae]|uniref:EMI domain-containing protein 1 n=1 Tax=Liparis tanakae TaxID=230148 RepID=A0A4Z2GHS7_9TELE|nr:EMI domain-containing protein 1 [Liparis tanakae]
MISQCNSYARNQLGAQEAVRKPSTLRRPPARTGEAVSNCLNCSRITALTDRLSSLEEKVQLYTAPASISQRQGKGPEASSLTGAVPAQGAPGEQGPAEMGFLAEKGRQGLEGCRVPVGPRGKVGQGAPMEPLDRRDLQGLQAPVVHKESQERGVYQARRALQGLQLRPVPTSQNQITVVEKTSSIATPSMTLEGCLSPDLRVLPGLSVHRVPEAQQDRLARQGRTGNLESLDRTARWVQRESGPLGYQGERGFRGESDISLQMFRDLQADLELLARRVTLLEAIIWPEPDLGSGDGPFGTASPSFYRDKRAGALPYRLASPLSTNTKVRGK